MSKANHHQAVQTFAQTLTASPRELVFHYVRAVLAEEKGCVMATARRLGMHRRTLQRMLGKSKPAPRASVQ